MSTPTDVPGVNTHPSNSTRPDETTVVVVVGAAVVVVVGAAVVVVVGAAVVVVVVAPAVVVVAASVVVVEELLPGRS